MSRLEPTFAQMKTENKKALIPFVTAGFPEMDATLPILHTLAAAGADIIEIGIPFSDPMADGPVIQRASERALKNGMTLKKVLEIVHDFRESNQKTPVVLMGYANPLEAMGWESFAKEAAKAGVDGVLVVDYPPEEAAEFSSLLAAESISMIFLLAPTSDAARIAKIAKVASAYVYYVSLAGVTGSAALDVDAVAARLPAIRKQSGLPVGVGFGIRDAASAARIAMIADAVIIGSRLIEEIEEPCAETRLQRLHALMVSFRNAIDKVSHVKLVK